MNFTHKTLHRLHFGQVSQKYFLDMFFFLIELMPLIIDNYREYIFKENICSADGKLAKPKRIVKDCVIMISNGSGPANITLHANATTG